MNNIFFKEVENGNDKIGFHIENNAYVIYIPKYYLKDNELTIIDEATKIKLKKIFKAWTKYQKNVNSKLGIKFSKENKLYDLNISMKILQDFIENGLYVEQEKIYVKRNIGKMNFKKTINSCKPIYTNQGPIYLKYVTASKKENDEDLIKYIQSLILNDISKKIGWIIGFNFKFPVYKNIKLDTNLINVLKLKQMETFNSRKLNLITLFIDYILNNKINVTEESSVFVGMANLFWQDIINEVIGNVSQSELEKIFYVRHAYLSPDKCKKLYPLIPDTIYKDTKNIIIIDSKYYLNENLPNNDDINKQFIYMIKAFNYFNKNQNFKNCFIFPTNKETYISEKQIVFDMDIYTDKELTPINLIYANVERLIDLYIEDKKDNNIIKDLIVN